jgi:hypothetical protein
MGMMQALEPKRDDEEDEEDDDRGGVDQDYSQG